MKGIPSTGFGTTQFTFGGHNRSAWSVDGLDNTQRRFNRPIRLVISTPESVQEMQVISGAYSAEFGRAAGGVINVISRSGTNDLHFGGMWFYRPRQTAARPPLASTKPNQKWWMIGGNAGGALSKDRLWFFINDEYNPLKVPQPVTINPDVARILQIPASDLGNSPFGETFHTPSAKLNFRLNDRNSGFIRYNRFTNDQPGGGGGLTTIGRSTTFEDRMNGGAAQFTTVISPTVLNEVRFGINRRAETRLPVGQVQPGSAAVNISGTANFGVNPLTGSASVETSTQIIDNVTWTLGKHTMKAGLDFQTTGYDVTSAQNVLFLFNGLGAAAARPAVTPLDQYLRTVAAEVDPATGRPYTYTQLQQTIGDAFVALRYNFVNFFAQDEFRVSPGFTLNFGLRYELVLNPLLDDQAPFELSRKIDNDTNNIAPRFGFSWSPFASNITVIRGGYGIYSDSPSLAGPLSAAQNNGRRLFNYVVPGADPRGPRFPNLLTAGNAFAATPPTITVFPRDFQVMYGHNASLQLERQVLTDLAVNFQYQFWGHRFAPYSRDINLSAPVRTLEDGRLVYQGSANRPDPRFRGINLLESGANSNYNGLDVTLTKRFQRGFQMSATWSWSHALSNGDLEGGALSNPADRQTDYGNSNADVRHNLVLNALYAPAFQGPAGRVLNGFEFSSVMFYNSGYPVNATAGLDLNQDLVLNDRALFRGRNALGGPAFFQWDARLVRKIRLAERHTLELIAESENFLNRLNPNCSIAGCSGAVQSREGLADFGRILSTRPGRQFQFGMRYWF